MLASASLHSHNHSNTDLSLSTTERDQASSTMPSPQGPQGSNTNDLFPLDFLTFSNFDSTSPLPNNQNQNQNQNQQDKQDGGMEFDFSQFQNMDGLGGESGHNANANANASASGSGSRRGSVDLKRVGRSRASISSLGGLSTHGQGQGQGQGQGMEVDQNQLNELQAMLDAASAGASASASGSGSGHGIGQGQGQESYDQTAAQAGLLQQQLEHIHMQSPMIFGNGQQTNFNNLAQYLASPPAAENNPSAGSDADIEKKKWMLATGLGGMFTPGPSGEMIPQVRPDQMSPMQLEMLAREFDGDFSNIAPLMSPALSQQQSSSSYTSPHQTAMYGTRTPNQQTFNPQPQQPQQQPQSRSPLEALQIQQRHFQEQLALLQHQQRQLQATAEAVAAASNSPYVSGTNPSSGSSHPVTTPGVGGAHSTNPSPSYFSPLTSPALEASGRVGGFARQQNQHQSYSPNFDPRTKRQPHPLSALSSPALNPIGSSGGAQQTLSPALAPQNNTDMSDPDYYRALVGMLDGSNQLHQQQQQQLQNQQRQQRQMSSDGSGSLSQYTSPAALQYIDTSALSSPMVGPSSATSNGGQGYSHAMNNGSGPGPNRQALPSRTRPSPMIKPSPGLRGHHSRHGSTSAHHSPNVNFNGRYHNASVPQPQPNYLPPAAIDQRGVQAHHQQIAQSTHSETPSPVDLTSIMPPPPVPNGLHGSGNAKAVTPMTPASLMNLGGGRAAVLDTASQEGQSQGQGKRQAGRAAQITRPIRKTGTNGNANSTVLNGSGSGSNGANSANGKKVKIAPGKRALAVRPPGVGVRAATKGAAAAAAASNTLPEGETRKTSHKAAEQKRRDSLKAGFDELRLLLPPINTEALDPESGEPIPGSSAPRLLPKSSLVPDDNPNRGVSKVALLKFSNEYIERLHEKVDKRDDYIERLRNEVARLRTGDGDAEEVKGVEGQDLLEIDMLDGEEEYDGLDDEGEEGVEGDEGIGLDEEEEDEEGMDEMELDQGDGDEEYTDNRRRKSKNGLSVGKSPALGPSHARVKA